MQTKFNLPLKSLWELTWSQSNFICFVPGIRDDDGVFEIGLEGADDRVRILSTYDLDAPGTSATFELLKNNGNH